MNILNTAAQRQRPLQLSLYSGIVLIVISMLFLGREQNTQSFIGQAVMVLAVPAFFYVVGFLVYRYLHATLAAPGIIATGAWLIGVGLIHLYDKRNLLPDGFQSYYWLAASLLAGTLITLTGHRVRIWMLVPLVPLVQVNALWATLSGVGIPVQWMPPISFILVLLWWELPFKDQHWQSVYRASAVLLSLFLLVFTIWLPLTTPQTLMVTWGAGASVIAILGLRHGWTRLGPLAIIMLMVASIWGLPASLWSPVGLILAASTVIYIETLAYRRKDGEKGKDSKALEISEALAVILSGAAALFAQIAPLVQVPMHPLGIVAVLFGAGALLAGLGWRRTLRIASHAGLWLIASAWAGLYFVVAPDSGLFGLWLALLAAGALLVERLIISNRKEKGKGARTISQTVTYWPLADLVIGLTTIILIWTGIGINAVPPAVLLGTFTVVLGVWIAAGLVYRLPVLLHVALWVAPLPYALLLLIADPAIWTLPLMGIAWQFLGIAFLLLGHSLPRYRPAILAPFFIVGYALLGFGFTLAVNTQILMPLSLTLVILACTGTSAAVIVDRHPVWTVFVSWLIQPEKRPYAFRSVHHGFLFLSAWLSAVWLHLMLGYTVLALPRQGIFLVLFACIWFVLGRLLSRLPKVVGWPVIGAGWLLWVMGLMEVFFSPTEALITVVLGLIISGEALRRTRELYWIPVVVIQIFFTALQLAWILTLPGYVVVLLVSMSICAGGMFYERYALKAGRLTAFTGAALTASIFFFMPDTTTVAALTVLSLFAVLHYRRWWWLWPLYFSAAMLVALSRIPVPWIGWLGIGMLQVALSVELVRVIRPRGYRTLTQILVNNLDWAAPPMWIGIMCTVIGLGMGLNQRADMAAPSEAFFLVALLVMFITIRLPIPRLPYVSLLIAGAGLMLLAMAMAMPTQSLASVGSSLIGLSITLSLSAIFIYWLCTTTRLRIYRARWMIWWFKPMIKATYFLAGTSVLFLILIGNLYWVDPALRITNGFLLAIFATLVYGRQQRAVWLWGSILIAWYSWTLALIALGLTTPIWQTLPLGIGLLSLARYTPDERSPLLEYAGTVVLVAGSILSLTKGQLTSLSPALILPLLHIAGLGLYGYTGRRRIPFVSAILLVTVGLVLIVAKVNMWLIPLACGLLLIGGTLIAEVSRDSAEHWLSGWVTRWHSWK